MSCHQQPCRAPLGKLLAAFIMFGAAAGISGASLAADPALDGAMPHIKAVLHDPAVSRRIAAWGLTIADVQHDVDALSLADRARLAYLLRRRWRSNETHSQADLQAQFLVTLSLMRESTLFASVISSGASKLR